MWQLRVLKEGVRKQRKIQKSILILERDFSPIYSVLNKFLANYYPKTRASERTRSFCYFAIFFFAFQPNSASLSRICGSGKNPVSQQASITLHVTALNLHCSKVTNILYQRSALNLMFSLLFSIPVTWY